MEVLGGLLDWAIVRAFVEAERTRQAHDFFPAALGLVLAIDPDLQRVLVDACTGKAPTLTAAILITISFTCVK